MTELLCADFVGARQCSISSRLRVWAPTALCRINTSSRRRSKLATNDRKERKSKQERRKDAKQKNQDHNPLLDARHRPINPTITIPQRSPTGPRSRTTGGHVGVAAELAPGRRGRGRDDHHLQEGRCRAQNLGLRGAGGAARCRVPTGGRGGLGRRRPLPPPLRAGLQRHPRRGGRRQDGALARRLQGPHRRGHPPPRERGRAAL